MQGIVNIWNQFWAIAALGRLAKSLSSGDGLRPALIELRRHSFGPVRRRIDTLLAEMPERSIREATPMPGMEWPRP